MLSFETDHLLVGLKYVLHYPICIIILTVLYMFFLCTDYFHAHLKLLALHEGYIYVMCFSSVM